MPAIEIMLGLSALATVANTIAATLNAKLQRSATTDNLVLSHELSEPARRDRTLEALRLKERELEYPQRLFSKEPDEFRLRIDALSRRGERWYPSVIVTPFDLEQDIQFGRTVRESVEGLWQVPDAPVSYGLVRRAMYQVDSDVFDVHQALDGAPSIVLFGRVHKFGRRVEPRIAVVGIEGQVRPVSFRVQPLDVEPDAAHAAELRAYAESIATLAIMAADALAWATAGEPPLRLAGQPVSAEQATMLTAFAALAAAVRPAQRNRIAEELHRMLDPSAPPVRELPPASLDRVIPSTPQRRRGGWV